MNPAYQETKEKIIRLLDTLNYEHYYFIVEGKKDEHALQTLGIKFIITLRARPLYKILDEFLALQEQLGTIKIVILTDLDTEGKKLHGKLYHLLSMQGIFIHKPLRNLLFKTPLRQIEGLATFLETNSFLKRN